jgi:hypothetical protein
MAAESPPQPQRRPLPNPFVDPPLLQGLMDAPVLSLVEAVQLTNIDIDESCIALACAHHRNMAPPDAHGLTPDEIGAFHLYTQTCFFFELNKVLREMDRPRVTSCLPYLRLLVAGMHKLPKRSGVVFRGIKTNIMDTLELDNPSVDLAEAFPPGHEFLWWGVTTTSTQKSIVESYMGRVGRRTMFTMRVHSAVDAAPYSADGGKYKEWTLAPGAHLRVVGEALDCGEIAVIELEEFGNPYSLAQFVEADRRAGLAKMADVENAALPSLLDGLVNAQVLPLADAVHLTNIRIDQSCIAAALEHHRLMSPPDAHGLTPDEIGAFHLYSQDCPFFAELNKLLRNMDRPRVAACLPYLRLLVCGMSKLPRCSGQVFRGIKTNLMDTLGPETRGLPLSEAFPEGSELEFWGVTTTYKSARIVSQFLGTEGRRTIFSIKVHSAFNAAPYSASDVAPYLTGGGKHVNWTLAPGARFQVIDTADLGDVVSLHLEEVGTPSSLLQFEEVNRLEAVLQSPTAMDFFNVAELDSNLLSFRDASPACASSQSPMSAAVRSVCDLAFLHATPLVCLKPKPGSNAQRYEESPRLNVHSEVPYNIFNVFCIDCNL